MKYFKWYYDRDWRSYRGKPGKKVARSVNETKRCMRSFCRIACWITADTYSKCTEFLNYKSKQYILFFVSISLKISGLLIDFNFTSSEMFLHRKLKFKKILNH